MLFNLMRKDILSLRFLFAVPFVLFLSQNFWYAIHASKFQQEN